MLFLRLRPGLVDCKIHAQRGNRRCIQWTVPTGEHSAHSKICRTLIEWRDSNLTAAEQADLSVKLQLTA